MDMEYGDRLIRLYNRVYSKPASVRFLDLLGKVSVLYVALAYGAVCADTLINRGWQDLARLVAMAAIPFLLVSLMRGFLNCQRPYEVMDIAPFERMKAQRKAGKSFPSRHVFSAFLIGALLFEYSALLGVMTLLVGVYIAIERVLLGIHFTKDVVAGALMGTLSGVIGTLIL